MAPAAARVGDKRARDADDTDAHAAEQDGGSAAAPDADGGATIAAHADELFDYTKESAALSAALFQRPAGVQRDFGALFRSVNEFTQRHAELRARAAAARFYGFAPRALELALELLNRRHATRSIMPGVAVAGDECWDMRTVKGRHTKPCAHCDEPFEHYGQLFFQECSRGPWDADKLCEGCMGAKLRAATGGVTDAAALEALLVPLRAAQPGGIEAGWWAQSYMRA